MTMFYQTKEGFFAGELIEEYGDSFLVKILIDNGVEVKESRYALVTHLTKRAVDLRCTCGSINEFHHQGCGKLADVALTHANR